jgi:hypothetical protein
MIEMTRSFKLDRTNFGCVGKFRTISLKSSQATKFWSAKRKLTNKVFIFVCNLEIIQSINKDKFFKGSNKFAEFYTKLIIYFLLESSSILY